MSGRRAIGGGCLIDLDVLQACVRRGVLGEDDVWMATERCERDLQNYRIDLEGVLTLLASLRDVDYCKSEWCSIGAAEMVPCDVYRIRYDLERWERNRNGLEVYLKFSIDEDGGVSLILVSCHGSR